MSSGRLFDYQIDAVIEVIGNLRDRCVKVGPIEDYMLKSAAEELEVTFEDEIKERMARLANASRSSTEIATERYLHSRVESGIEEATERWIERDNACRGNSSSQG